VILSNALYTIRVRVNLLIELIKALVGLVFILKNDAFKSCSLLKLRVRVIVTALAGSIGVSYHMTSFKLSFKLKPPTLGVLRVLALSI
jgi:hypothetical protein